MWQPHAALIVAGRKRTEDRSWRTGFRGLLWVHAGLEYDADAPPWEGPPLVFGAILGSIELYAIEGTPGAYRWLLRDPVELAEPIECRGWPSLWRVPAGLIPGETGE